MSLNVIVPVFWFLVKIALAFPLCCFYQTDFVSHFLVLFVSLINSISIPIGNSSDGYQIESYPNFDVVTAPTATPLNFAAPGQRSSVAEYNGRLETSLLIFLLFF